MDTSRPGGSRGNWKPRWRGRGFYPRNSNFYGRGRAQDRGRTTFSSMGHSTKPASSHVQDSPQHSQTSQPSVKDIFDTVPTPYVGWKQYLPQEVYSDGSPTVDKIKAVEQYIKKNLNLYSASDIMERRSFVIDLKHLMTDDEFKVSWFTFNEELTENPEHTMSCLGLAMHQVVSDQLQAKLQQRVAAGLKAPAQSLRVPTIRARLINYEPVIQLKNLKANYYGKLVAVHGTIIRVSSVKLLCVWMAFECNICHGMQCVKQPEGVLTIPTKCRTGGCRGRTFTPLHSSPYTQTINWQSVRLQELVADDRREGGRVPRTVECELTEDLLDSCVPGDVVTVIGIIKVRNNEENQKRKAPSMFLLYIDAVSVVNNKSQSLEERKSAFGVRLNAKDFYAVKEIHSQPSLFRLLVNSLCPTIYGHELVKAGLLLGLFGGTQKSADMRADIHVLVVGDPGLGKSQMLQACGNVAPRGVYVCGNTSTTSGLTVTLTRESGGDYTLEAGALVLADQGCCCIDEFDKMSSQHQALLEAMEQQSISIAKAGIVCSLPARTSILAAANPVGGHYNRAKTVSENLRMGSALLSRFDLVFILMDRPNEHLDSLLSEHVMALHSGIKNKEVLKLASAPSCSQAADAQDIERSLSERLKYSPGEEFDPIPQPLLRKYIAYARKYTNPRLTPEAADIIQKFYLELRRQYQAMDCTPITTRQLESMIRLCEARAKLELRSEVSEIDALEVVEIMRYSLVDTMSDSFGTLHFQRSQNGSGMSSKSKAKKFIMALQRQAEVQSRSVFSVQELKEIAKLCVADVSDFTGFLSSLNVQGFLLKKGPQLYQLLTVDY
ncbi:DNA helicase MCM8-like isoform X1 [Schistocerca nitens]|uniref:DNA helicase MCM8-like isoform X1 n=1 Tax=Schistocerca nitens TaxID=7011 RepID=UPI0021197100|nr:DNA helicase MCM8-like isoform X1 [Schistocerca nitens]